QRHADWDRARLQASGSRWPTDAMILPNCSMPRDLFLAHGGFDEDYKFVRHTDDLAMRLWRSGVPFCWEPKAACTQIYDKPNWTLASRDAARFGHNEILLYRKLPWARAVSALAGLAEGSPSPRWR